MAVWKGRATWLDNSWSLYMRMIITFWVFGLSYVLIGGQADRPRDSASPSVVVKRPIIDMHLHALTFEEFGPSAKGTRPPNPITGKPPEAKTSADLLRLTLEAMDRYNIKLGMLSGRLEAVYAWKAKASDRFLASVAIVLVYLLLLGRVNFFLASVGLILVFGTVFRGGRFLDGLRPAIIAAFVVVIFSYVIMKVFGIVFP